MEKIKLNFYLNRKGKSKMNVLLRYTFKGQKEKNVSIQYLEFEEKEWLDKQTCKKYGYVSSEYDVFNRPYNKSKHKAEINILKDIRDEILNYVETLTYDYLFNFEHVKDIVIAHNPNREIENEKPKNLLDLIQFQINYHKNLGDISHGQIANYGDLYNSLLVFKDSVFFNKLSFNIIEFKQRIFHMYEDFLINKGCVNSSIRTYLKNFLSICNKISTNLDINLDTTYKIRTKNIQEIKEVLSDDEVMELYNYDFNDKKLNYNKIFLLIQYCTGCRFSDLANLSSKNIVENSYIQYNSVKNGIQGTILINNALKGFLINNNYYLPTYKYSRGTYNKYLKKMFKIVFSEKKCEYRLQSQIGDGLNKTSKKDVYFKYQVISSHMIRRSFATYHLVDNNLPVSVVSQMMAHNNITTTLNYVNLNKERCLDEQLKSQVKKYNNDKSILI